MSQPLQEHHWKKSRYERPTFPWVCGKAAGGEPCPLGPSVEGRCSLTDSPCRPKRSDRVRRRRLCMAATLAGAVVCLWFWFGASKVSLSPGPVTNVHSVFEESCENCHTTAETARTDWVGRAWHGLVALQDSQRCVVCHHEWGDNALDPHSVEVFQLASYTKRSRDLPASASKPLLLSFATSAAALGLSAQDQWACATCHHEHNGRTFDLNQLSDLQCQSCHVQQFASFEDEHPELGAYPYDRRTRIYFDHQKHYLKHFADFKRNMPGGVKPASCASCHMPDAQRDSILTLGFDQSCGSCHEPQIRDAQFPGVTLISVPDAKLFDESIRASVGDWPTASDSRAAFLTPPFMKLLLGLDDQKAAWKNWFGTGAVDPAQRTEAAWAIKQWLFDVNSRGERQLQKRLAQWPKLLPLRPAIVDAVGNAAQRWFPRLAEELNARQAGSQLSEKPQSPVVQPHGRPPGAGGGWYVDDRELALRYRPIGHADPVIRACLETVIDHWNRPDKQPVSKPIGEMFELLSNPSASGTIWNGNPVASGRCLTCHTIDRKPDGKYAINWRSYRPHSGHRGFTRFSHKPHLTALGDDGCRHCHQLNESRTGPAVTFHAAFFARDPLSRVWKPNLNPHTDRTSGFASVSKSACVGCHRQDAAGNRCLSCHNYHVHGDSLTE